MTCSDGEEQRERERARVDVTEASELLDELLQRLGHVREVAMRIALAGEWLERAEARLGAWAVAALMRGALRAKRGYAEALWALCLALLGAQRRGDEAVIKHLFYGAHEVGREGVLYLCRDAPPRQQLAANTRLPPARLPFDREVTLGERRALASGSNRRYLERLLSDPNPMVIAKLLSNPALGVQEAVQLASKRPTTPALLATLIDTPRWLVHGEVREALVRNPFIQTGYALKLVPTLKVDVLRQVARSGELHQGVCDFAALLVAWHEW